MKIHERYCGKGRDRKEGKGMEGRRRVRPRRPPPRPRTANFKYRPVSRTPSRVRRGLERRRDFMRWSTGKRRFAPTMAWISPGRFFALRRTLRRTRRSTTGACPRICIGGSATRTERRRRNEIQRLDVQVRGEECPPMAEL